MTCADNRIFYIPMARSAKIRALCARFCRCSTHLQLQYILCGWRLRSLYWSTHPIRAIFAIIIHALMRILAVIRRCWDCQSKSLGASNLAFYHVAVWMKRYRVFSIFAVIVVISVIVAIVITSMVSSALQCEHFRKNCTFQKFVFALHTNSWEL